ncbi:MAG: TonB-dependent receptor [Chitinophagales bacterium]
MLRYFFTIIFLLHFSFTGIFAQKTTLKGYITDAETNERLLGVNIVSENKEGTVTDIDGNYELQLQAGTQTVTFSYIGYQNIKKEFTLIEGSILEANIAMTEEKRQLDVMVVSASQYEKRIAEETVSIDVIQDYIIENNNTRDLAEAVQTIPGVNIVDGQATIRGGSGYAYGTGSRVQVLVDDMPLLTGDFSEVRWEFVPMEQAEQIEVIKGASSVLYGSSALNGVISVQTGFAKSKPETKISLFQGFYFNPRNDSIKWWNNRHRPMFSGMFFSNRQKIGNLDLVMGGNYKYEKSYLKDGDNKHFRFNVKTRYIHPKNQRLHFGINANALYQHWGRFFLFNSLDEPYQGAISDDRYSLVTIDPYVSYRTESGWQHKLKTRLYNITRYRQSGFRTHNSNLFYSEYQIQKRLPFGMSITAGGVASLIWGYNVAYNDGNPVGSYSGGAYGQVEQKVGRLNLVAGARYEVNATDVALLDSLGIEDTYTPLVIRLGANYRITENTFMRFSYGQGYRSPSIVERFIEDKIPYEGLDLKLFPNPELVPEKGWNAEIGVKQGYNFANKVSGYLDLALFWSEINNMTEFTFVNYDGIGFQTQNVEGARIAGWEISGSSEIELGEATARLYGGFTFNYPSDMRVDTSLKMYMNNLVQSWSSVDSLSDALLKYRFRKVGRLDAELEYKKLTIGYNFAFNGRMEKVDEIFTLLPNFGVEEFAAKYPKGSYISNARILYAINENSSVALVAKNIFNKEYMLRPGLMESPANVTIQYKMKL